MPGPGPENRYTDPPDGAAGALGAAGAAGVAGTALPLLSPDFNILYIHSPPIDDRPLNEPIREIHRGVPDRLQGRKGNGHRTGDASPPQG